MKTIITLDHLVWWRIPYRHKDPQAGGPSSNRISVRRNRWTRVSYRSRRWGWSKRTSWKPFAAVEAPHICTCAVASGVRLSRIATSVRGDNRSALLVASTPLRDARALSQRARASDAPYCRDVDLSLRHKCMMQQWKISFRLISFIRFLDIRIRIYKMFVKLKNGNYF